VNLVERDQLLAGHHGSAILGTLNARSRGEAVATARRLGLGLGQLTPDG
jgi:hypothetical protein